MENKFSTYGASAFSSPTTVSSISTLYSMNQDLVNPLYSNQHTDFIDSIYHSIDQSLEFMEQPPHLFHNSTELKSWSHSLFNFDELTGNELILGCLPENTRGYADISSDTTSAVSSNLIFNMEGIPMIPSRRCSHNVHISSGLGRIGDPTQLCSETTELGQAMLKNQSYHSGLSTTSYVEQIPLHNLAPSGSELDTFIPMDQVSMNASTTPPLSPSDACNTSFFRPTKPSRRFRRRTESTGGGVISFRAEHKKSQKERKAEAKKEEAEAEVNICKFCERPFKRKHDLQRHERLHTGEKPFQCTHCILAFSRTDTLRRHLRQTHGYFEHLMFFSA
ncbi:hypothetical protein K7432_015841 [Basidiobolus ranarum]|uniref:C2H2-type domain-containing protein n=1 Tax=Basidiobolus ranarum TaxID=34480 RepID=A0ABR2VN72_9FUNG